MKIKIFKNNNLHINFSKNDIEEFKNSKLSDIEYIFYNLDFIPIGEEYCISNYEMAVDIAYNGGWNFYRFNYNYIKELLNCKTIILKPHTKKYYNEHLKKEFEEE